MAKATLTETDVDHRRSKRLMIDCAHGTTTAVFKPDPSNVVSEAEVIAAMVERHSTRHRCRCAKGLELPRAT